MYYGRVALSTPGNLRKILVGNLGGNAINANVVAVAIFMHSDVFQGVLQAEGSKSRKKRNYANKSLPDTLEDQRVVLLYGFLKRFERTTVHVQMYGQ